MTEEKLAWTTKRHPNGKVEVSVKDGTHAGWALQASETVARQKALARLRYAQEAGELSLRLDEQWGLT